MEFTTLAAMLAAQAADGLKVTVRDTRQSYIYLKNRPDLDIDNVNVFETPVSSDRWVAEKAIPTWDEAAIVSALGYTPEDAAQKGEPNGYPELDASSRIPLAQLPTSVQTLKGSWNASTNTPTLADGTGRAGDTYRVSVGATRNLGSGNLVFGVDDRVVYNGTTWEKWDTNDAVTSVHGRTGDVTAQAGDYSAHYVEKSAGAVLQVAYTQTIASSTGNTDMVWDDSIPQSNEGDEFLTCAITPKSATSKLIVEAEMFGGEDSNFSSSIIMAAIFRDAIADAISAKGWSAATTSEMGGNLEAAPMNLRAAVVSGSTDETIFKLRAGLAGNGVGAAFRLNGVNGGRKLGGALVTSIKITEVAA